MTEELYSMHQKTNDQKLDFLWNIYMEHLQKENPNDGVLNSLESMIRYLSDKSIEIDKMDVVTNTVLPMVERAIALFYQKES